MCALNFACKVTKVINVKGGEGKVKSWAKLFTL